MNLKPKKERLDVLLVARGLFESREKAQRKDGGIAIVVTTAMATIMVKRSWLSAPIDKPIEATITSVEPRA